MRTGFQIQILEDLEENHYIYLAVQHALKARKKQFDEANALIMEIGGGSTEILLLKKGKIETVHSFQLGTIRIAHSLALLALNDNTAKKLIQDQVSAITDKLNAELPLNSIEYFILLGSDARFIAQYSKAAYNENYWVLGRDDFIENCRKVHELPDTFLCQEPQSPH